MLIDQWVSLTEERNAILCPNSGSGVPGATSDWLVFVVFSHTLVRVRLYIGI